MAALKFTSRSGWEMEPVADEVSLWWWSSMVPISTIMEPAGRGGMPAALVAIAAEEGVVGSATGYPAGTALLPAGGKMAPAGAPAAGGLALMLLLLKLLLLVCTIDVGLEWVAVPMSGRRLLLLLLLLMPLLPLLLLMLLLPLL
eukprot:evm.model.NODE_23415_length_9299_cov_18.335304.2